MQPSGPWSDPDRRKNHQDRRLARTFFWIGVGIGVAALGATVTYICLRLTSSDEGEDPTTQRIQELIDEANSLLKALDEQRHSA